jgi:hypothetical protein
MGLLLYFSEINRIRTFFNMTGKNQVSYLQYDSTAMFVHKPNIKIYENWGTPNQKYNGERKTNNLGFREDLDIKEKKDSEYRILVTGDSHTDGAVRYNSNTFVNVWEKHLNSIDSVKSYNCINGGTAYYTFKNYLGFIKKYKYLKPDVYLINVFTGNDFRETFLYEDNRTNFSIVSKNITMRIKKKFLRLGEEKPALGQGIDQILYFKSFPNQKEEALIIAKKYIKEIKQICEKENIRLIITLLPSKIETNKPFKEKAKTAYNISETEIMTNSKLTNALISWLDTKAIENFNLTDALKNTNKKVFWDHDLHINNNGHEIVAEYLFNTIYLNNKN